MNNNILIMNFSHVYEYENFYREQNCNIVDFSNLKGTNCYCDDNTASVIKKSISPYNIEGLHFIDSGNYHYISSFWIERIKEPFVLVVLDNHTDMQEPAFGNILSCGSWVQEVLLKNQYLKKVILIGPPKSSYTFVSDKLIPIYKDDIKIKEKLKEIINLKKKYKMYMSIDKDILSKSYAVTSWSQGGMNLTTLERIIKYFYSSNTIGIDICGECPLNYDECNSRALMINDNTNKELIKFINCIFYSDYYNDGILYY